MNAAGYSFSGPQGIVEGTQASYAPVDGYTSDQLGVQTGGRHHKRKGSKSKRRGRSKSKHVCTEECMPCQGKTCDRDCNPCECTRKRLRSQKRKRKGKSKMRSRKGKKRTHKRAGMQGIPDDYVMDDYEDKAEENVVENRGARNFIDYMLGDYSDRFLNKSLGKREAMDLGVSGNAKEPETPAPESVPKSEHRAGPKPDPKSRTPKVMKRPEVPDDICEILGIEKNATDDEIKEAYRKAVRVYHPDKTRNDPDKAAKEEQFKKISDYYDKTGIKAKTKKKRRRKRTKKPKRKHKRAGAVAVVGGAVATLLAQNIWNIVRSGAQTAADYKIISEDKIPDPLLEIINRKLKDAGMSMLKRTRDGIVFAGKTAIKKGGDLANITSGKINSLVKDAFSEYEKRGTSRISPNWVDVEEEAYPHPRATKSRRSPTRRKSQGRKRTKKPKRKHA